MASLTDRLAKLEARLVQQDPMRVIDLAEHADYDETVKRYRQETGYRGIVVAMSEADRAL